ncbi:MAG TPA: hypothetical protein VG929_04850 [Actinomycetota bacterium]|nr:hypothetical protein [Actinomycetota bacterium]
MAAIVALTTTAVIVGALAGHLPVRDADDTRGALDIRRATNTGGSRPRWNVITFEGWKAGRIFDVGYVTILLDTVANERPDYYVLVGSFGNRLYAHLWRDRAHRPDYRVGSVNVWKPNWKSVAVKLPLSRMSIGSRRLVYRWQVETLFTGARCRNVCFDLAPDSQAVAEPLPGLTQPPSPTPSVTPTPDPSGTPTPEPTRS